MGYFLGKPASLGTHQDNWTTLKYRLDRGKYGFRLHHHARTAAIGVVVHDMVPVTGRISWIIENYLDDAVRSGARHDTLIERAPKHLGKQREDIKVYRRCQRYHWYHWSTPSSAKDSDLLPLQCIPKGGMM